MCYPELLMKDKLITNTLSPKSRLRKIILSRPFKFLFLIVILGGIAFQMSKFGGIKNLSLSLQSPLLLIYAFFFTAIAFLIHYINWYAMLRKLDFASISFYQGLFIYFYSGLARYLPGTFWYLISRSAVSVQYGVSSASSLFCTGAELILKVAAGVIISVIGFTFLGQAFDPTQWMWIGIWSLFGGFIIILYFMINKDSATAEQKNSASVKDLTLLFTTLRKLSVWQIGSWMMAYITAWVVQGVSILLILNSFIDVPFSSLGLIIAAYTTAWVIGFINPLTPAGLGLRETIMISLLSTLVAPGLVLVASLILRLLSLLSEIGFTALGWLFNKARTSKKTPSKNSEGEV